MLKNSIKYIFSVNEYMKMFFIYGILLGVAFHFFNSEGKNLVTSIVGALSSPDLFYLLLSTSAIYLCLRNSIKGPIEGEVSSLTQNVAIFPGQAAIEGMKSLLALLAGLIVPLWAYSTKLGILIAVFFLCVFVTCIFSSMLYLFSYQKTTPKSLSKSWFKIINLVIALVLVLFFYYSFIYQNA